MAKRKISGIINATEHPMNLETPWNQKQPDGTYHAYAGDDIEAFLKKELSNRTPTEELVSGETKPPTSGTVFDAMVGTVTDVDVQDSEDGTQYVMTVKQKDNQGGESSKEVRFSKYTDDDKVVVNIDLTDSGGVFGVAILENAYDQTCEVTALPPEEIAKREPALLLRPRLKHIRARHLLFCRII